MNIKKIIIFCVVVLAIIAIGSYLVAKGENDSEQVQYVNEQIAEREDLRETVFLTITSKEKKYFEEYDSENYEVIVKNTSGKDISKIEFRFDQNDYAVYTLHELKANEEYKIIAYNTLEIENFELKIASITFNNMSIFEGENNLKELDVVDGKIIGKIANIGQRNLYPNEILFYIKDSNGVYMQKGLNYSGCFFDDLVINPGIDFEFEYGLKDGETLDKDKGIIYIYSDLEFKSYEIQNIK